MLNYEHILLLFSKYWSKTIERQNLQNKGNRTNWRPEFFVIFWLESLIMDQILLRYFFCFSFNNRYYLEKKCFSYKFNNFVYFASNHNNKTQIANQYFLLWSLYLLYLMLDQCTNSPNKSCIYWLFTFFCFKYNNDWLRIHKVHQWKQFEMNFGTHFLFLLIYFWFT